MYNTYILGYASKDLWIFRASFALIWVIVVVCHTSTESNMTMLKGLKVAQLPNLHYEKKLTKNIRPTDVLQIYTSI